jgi:hypothetical protein
MTIDIYIREKSGKREIRIPLLPESFSFPSGDVMFITSDIMGRGEVAVPSGTELGNYSWESEFPGELRKNDPMMHGSWQDPKNYVSILDYWKANHPVLNLLIVGYPVNVDVYLKEFTPTASGPFGDISYKIVFVEARSITINTTKVETSQLPQRQYYRPNTYTIVAGDCLWTISERFYATSDMTYEIYKANKEIIEKTAKQKGFKSSDNGHWIFPGTTIILPDV